MTMVDAYPPGWHTAQFAPEFEEMSPHASVKSGFDPGVGNNLASAPSGDFHSKSQLKRLAIQMEVTPEEEAEWIEKLNRMAGTHE